MALSSIVQMAGCVPLQERVLAAVAASGVRENPLPWMRANIWSVVATPGFAEAWEAGAAAQEAAAGAGGGLLGEAGEWVLDAVTLGADGAVITDTMLMEAVAAALA